MCKIQSQDKIKFCLDSKLFMKESGFSHEKYKQKFADEGKKRQGINDKMSYRAVHKAQNIKS